jgi:SAM-dependent methyltransferase
VNHFYDDNFFSWNNRGVAKSAEVIVGFLMKVLRPRSVLDVGCGQGVWLRAWAAAGTETFRGIDGAYVNQDRLLVPPAHFSTADLSIPFDLGTRFDLVQSLEVAEHLPPSSSLPFVQSLVKHADIVLFSAAVVGQGGEHHINERPLEFWRELFHREGFACFDSIRPAVGKDRDVQPWYRYNTLLYANATGTARLPPSLARTWVAEGEPLREGGDLPWRARRAVLRMLPTPAVSYLAKQRASWTARKTPRG